MRSLLVFIVEPVVQVVLCDAFFLNGLIDTRRQPVGEDLTG